MHDRGDFTILVSEPDAGKRLDVVIASRLSGCSRSHLSSLIREGKIRVQGAVKKPGYRVRPGEEIRGSIPPPEPISFEPEPIPIHILFEDDHLVVINKQPGLVVHPAPGHYTGTVVNGLLYHCPQLGGIGGKLRPGIVHRLDKDTSGALVIAKTDAAHRHLSSQFKARKVKKTYIALVQGEMETDSGTIALTIGRHPVDRKRMSTTSQRGRSAETSWRVRERFHGSTLLEVNLKTGRTHQIRVHCAAVSHPIIGDPVYGGRKAGKSPFPTPGRQMLHAWRLEFVHPISEKVISFEAPLPADMAALIESLRNKTNRI